MLNEESFAILVLMALFTTFITTPTVMAIYKGPGNGGKSDLSHKHRKLANKNPKDQLRILACLHGLQNVPSLITLIESTRSTKKSQLKLFVMHLVELTERSSSIIMVQRARKNGLPFINRFRRGAWHDQVTGAFQAYSQLGRVSVRPITEISSLSTMHEDICQMADTKRVAIIILPFHKQWKGDDDESIENVGHGWRLVNQRVLKHAPCSVGVLVDRGFGNKANQTPSPNTIITQNICVVFFGGPDDREALELAGRMVEHPGVKLTLLRIIFDMGPESPSFVEDDEIIGEFKSKWEAIIEYKEKRDNNIKEEILEIGRSGDYELIIVGNGRFPANIEAKFADHHQPEHAELGPVGDLLASPGYDVVSSVLVIQQHQIADTDHDTSLPKITSPDGSSNV